MKIKIIFVLPSLVAGGAERVMSFLASNLDTHKFEASLLITGTNSEQAYTISENTPVTFLNKSRVKNALPAMALHIYRNKPHIVMGAIGHVNLALAILAIYFRKVKFIGRETTVISIKNQIENVKLTKSFWPDLRTLFLDKIVCQSIDMKNDFVINFDFPEKKILVINNPVTSKFKLKKDTTKEKVPNFISIGRLTKLKGFERILRVLAKLEFPFHYTLIGDGEDKQKLLVLIHSFGLTEKLTYIPFTTEVEKYLANSDLYLSGSFVEGFPNTFLESCAVGTPVLAFDAPGGINEIIVNGLNGYVAKDEQEFQEKLILAISKNWDPSIVRTSVLEKFNEAKILKEYENLFYSVL